ncbi:MULTISPECIES: serine hydrolase domain-containing protein [Streptomyces]|uniref:serine hydrolase domain-containing protein n=1 Tax=Streptomyces TaxID=1883 RepID=UPI00073DFBE3|nr:serine hydrolase domain-containing protein [Streptomyces sp. FBKL.4005]MYU27271.1 serine hydrolase [Streptomyces sp. SID7810]OYP19687.1 serine hydrolase [Streptomyces sp. FBKL.4005]CUW26117.1 D-alanyl-D-alanine carboxypeptidase precursor [Streptomyces reticuli]
MSPTSVRLRRAAMVALLTGTLVAPCTAGAAPASVPSAPAAGTPGPSPSGPDVRPLSPDVTRQLDASVRRVMREAKVPGVTVGIWTPGQRGYVRSFGVADKETGRRMTPDLYTRIGSETKTFTVTALLQLVDRGKVRLDDPIGRYVEGVPNGDRITLRQLAGMRSGLFNYSEDDDFFAALTSDPQRSFTPRQLLDYAFRHPVLFQPGQKFSYCNTNLILLGLVVEKESGQRLGDYLKQHILDPAGMKDTLLPKGSAFPTPHAQGYTDQTANGEVAETAGWNPSWGWAAGAMVSTLEDLRIWAPTVATGELPDGRRMISPATQRQRLVTPATPIPGAGYGLGIFDVQGWIGHNGSLPGYESLTIYLPATRTTLVVLLNTDIDHDDEEPSTLFGQAITEIISPRHVFDLPAAPAAR